MITTTMMPFAETIWIVLFMWVFPKSPLYPLNPFYDCIIRTLLWFYTDEPTNRIFPVNIDHSISFALLSQCLFHRNQFNQTNWHNPFLFVGIVFIWNRAKLFNYWKQIFSSSILVFVSFFLFLYLVIVCLTFLISLLYFLSLC